MLRIVEPLDPSRKTHMKSGDEAEALAARFLIARGMKVIARNVRTRLGEIDLVCKDGKTTVFVEVRLRTHKAFGCAAESITTAKQKRIIAAAQQYLVEKPANFCRFDVVLLDRLDESAIEWIRHAFDAT